MLIEHYSAAHIQAWPRSIARAQSIDVLIDLALRLDEFLTCLGEFSGEAFNAKRDPPAQLIQFASHVPIDELIAQHEASAGFE